MDYIKLKEEIEKVTKIMKKLRGPDGCPWDRKQDYYSLKPYIIEEAYEVVDTLQEKNIVKLQEELGDLLLQVIFEAQIADEKGDFNLVDILTTLSNKLIRRHPHVFANKELEEVDEVKVIWNKIKKEEKLNTGEKKEHESIVDDYTKGQPAVNQAYEVQSKAAEVGFDWDKVENVVDKIEEELEEVKAAVKNKNRKEVKNELGDLIFATINLARFYKINPELALLGTITKFKNRFKYMEREAKNDSLVFEELTLKEMDRYWEKSKKSEEEE